MKSLLQILLFSFLYLPVLATADTRLVMESEAGDPIGGGKKYLFDLNNSFISAKPFYPNLNPAVSFLVISKTSGAQWELNFAAPGGSKLIPGTYQGAYRFPFNESKPGLSVSTDGQRCDTVTGTFEVTRVEHLAPNNLTSFEVIFEQHCNGSAAALRGTLQFNAPNPPETRFQMSGDAGDYITTGRTFDYSPNNANFSIFPNFGDYNRGITVNITAKDGTNNWSASFATGKNIRPMRGIYLFAQRFPFNGNQPGLDIGGSGRGCNTLMGTFEVLQADYNDDGSIRSFGATFEQHCEGKGPAARGIVKFNYTGVTAPPSPTCSAELQQSNDAVLNLTAENSELKSRLAAADTKNKELSASLVQANSNYETLKKTYFEVTLQLKKLQALYNDAMLQLVLCQSRSSSSATPTPTPYLAH